MFTPTTTARSLYRQELIAFASEGNLNLWVTLNTQRDWSARFALKALKRWRVEVLRRLHGRRFFDLPYQTRTWYVGAAEVTQAGHPHFHLAVHVPADLIQKFTAVGRARWEALAPSGSSWIEALGPEQADLERVLTYATKRLDLDAPTAFIHSEVDW